jgi:hypothetical protein
MSERVRADTKPITYLQETALVLFVAVHIPRRLPVVVFAVRKKKKKKEERKEGHHPGAHLEGAVDVRLQCQRLFEQDVCRALGARHPPSQPAHAAR